MSLQWIKLHCGKWFIGSTRWELTEAERSIWIDCLARAGLNDPPGRIDFYSLQQLADQFNTSLSFLEETLQKFIKLSKIDIDDKCIKILNWEKYQNDSKRHRKPVFFNIKNSLKWRKSNIKNSPKNRIEKNRKEKIYNTSQNFLTFWERYPRKVAKKAAYKAWMKLAPTPELTSTILEALERHKQTEQWQRNGGQFIPYPSTWLNGQRWEDELPLTSEEEIKKLIKEQRAERANRGTTKLSCGYDENPMSNLDGLARAGNGLDL